MSEFQEEDSNYKESPISSQQVKFTADLLRATRVVDPPPPGEFFTDQQEQKSQSSRTHPSSPCPGTSSHLLPLSWQGELMFERRPRVPRAAPTWDVPVSVFMSKQHHTGSGRAID